LETTIQAGIIWIEITKGPKSLVKILGVIAKPYKIFTLQHQKNLKANLNQKRNHMVCRLMVYESLQYQNLKQQLNKAGYLQSKGSAFSKTDKKPFLLVNQLLLCLLTGITL